MPANNTVMVADVADRQLALGSTGGQLTLVDMDSGQLADPVSVGTSAVFSITHVSRPATWVVGDASGQVHWVDGDTSALRVTWSVHGGPVTNLLTLNDTTYVSTGSEGTLVLQHTTPLRKLAATSIPLGAEGFSVDAHPETGAAYVGTNSSMIDVNLRERSIRSTTDIDSVVYSVAQLPPSSAGSHDVAVGDALGHIHVVRDGQVVQTIRTGADTVLALTPIDATNELIALTDNGDLDVYEVVAGRLGRHRTIGHDGFVAVAVSPDGRWVAYQHESGSAEIVRVLDGKRVGVVTAVDRGVAAVPTDAGIEALAFNDDATTLAVGFDGTVLLFSLKPSGSDAVTATVSQTLPIEAKPVGIGFDSGRVLVADSDGFVSTFDSQTGEPTGAVQAFFDSRDADATHGSSEIFQVAGGSLIIRDLTPEAVRQAACEVLWRPLSDRERIRFSIRAPKSSC